MAAAVKALLYLLVLIAFALRLYRLDYQSIWRDEGVSLHLAASSISAILANRAGDVHPALEVLCLHLHYFSIFAMAYANLFLAMLWLKGHRAINLRRWFPSQVLVALACAPWA
jgi:hypothetical protein